MLIFLVLVFKRMPMTVVQLVEQSPHNPEFKGSNPATDGAGRKH
jgi:hypothetical protein